MMKLSDKQVIEMVNALLEYECVRTEDRERLVRERYDLLPSVPALSPLFDRYERILDRQQSRTGNFPEVK